MTFFHYDFIGSAANLNATKNEDLLFVKLMNAMFDNLYITNSIDSEYHKRPDPWNFDTILQCDFLENLHAGNVEFTADEVTHILLKRRIKGTFDWVTLYRIDIQHVNDFSFERFDYYGQSLVEYEYCFVPVMNNIEGDFISNSVYSEFEGIFLVNRDYVFHALADAGTTNIRRERANATIATMGRKYPYVMSNGDSNYDTGVTSGLFTNRDADNLNLNAYEEEQLRLSLFDALSDGRPKVLKDQHSRIWLIMIVNQPEYVPVALSDPSGNTTFSWVEVGNHKSNADLYYNGLIDVLEESGE